jgi:dipeptidyl aminopeptidase/acylaminoacyl peptidase
VTSFSCGSIFLYRVEEKEVEEAGTLPDGILAASWAPNQEFFAVASKGGKLLVFTPDFEVLHEADIDDGDLTFHDVKDGDSQDKTIKDAQISWRGDSSIFVINYSINGGRKCLTRDLQRSLLVSKGPARADY